MTLLGKTITGIFIISVLLGSYVWFSHQKNKTEPITFTINGETVTLADETHVEDSLGGVTSRTLTTYFGNDVRGDFNGDTKEDKAFLVTQNTGGSGTFYYVATTLGGEALFLGDRIAPQSTDYKNGEIVVNYADRNNTDPMTTQPSVGVSKYFIVKEGKLTEVKHDIPEAQESPVTPTGTTTPKESTTGTTTSNGMACTKVGGTWSETYKECTGISEVSCKEIKGVFNECASACRHDPEAKVCVMMCAIICQL
ncbi:MAG: hypothetical protein WC444_01290 [Candidatus Paceibacterota bacterium]